MMLKKSDSAILDDAHAKAAHANGKMKRKAYEKELQELQVELCQLQDWVKETGERIIILFEGRDDQGHYRTSEPAGLSHSCYARAFGPPKDRDVHAALH